jgi:hypothetical protein
MIKFDTYVWLDGLGADGRLKLLQRIFEIFEEQDPGFRMCADIWRNGKTVRVSVTVPDGRGGSAEIGIHLSIEQNDRRLLDMLSRRLKRGEIILEKGKAAVGACSDENLVHAFMGRVGRGSVMLHVHRNEIVVGVSPRQIIYVPEDDQGANATSLEGAPPEEMATSSAACPGRTPGPLADNNISFPRTHEEGFVLLNFHGQFFLVAQFNNIRSAEIKAARHSPVTLGLTRFSKNLMVMAVKLPGRAVGWADMPYALGVEPRENQVLMPPDENGCATIMLALVEGRTGKTMALRALHMSKKWTAMLNDILEDQQEAAGLYDRSLYIQEVERSRRRWPSANDLQGSLEVVEVAAKF